MKTINGDSVESPITYTREQAGKLLIPPVTGRTVQEYLGIARVFVPGFEVFRECPNARIKEIHLPVLQKIREYVNETKSLVKARIRIAQEYGQR